MHPAYKSDKPGIAPDCGMKLEPVYADGAALAERPVSTTTILPTPKFHADNPGLNPETGNDLKPFRVGDAPGSVQVSSEKQQSIGVKYGIVTRGRGSPNPPRRR